MCVDIITFYQMKNHFEMKENLKKWIPVLSIFINFLQSGLSVRIKALIATPDILYWSLTHSVTDIWWTEK